MEVATPSTPSLQTSEKNVTPTAPAITQKPTLETLTKLYELGVITKEKLQQVFSEICPDPTPDADPSTPNPPIPDSNPSTPNPPIPNVNNPSIPNDNPSIPDTTNPSIPDTNPANYLRRKTHFRSLRKRKLAATAERPATPQSQKKSRPGKSSPKTASLRKLAKDPTRRRFFDQCRNLESLLWHRPIGNRKEEMDGLLFARAAKDPIDEMYSSHGGTLRAVTHTKLQSVVKWQVCFVVLQ